MKLITCGIRCLIIIGLLMFSFACEKEPDPKELLIGPWNYSIGNIHSVISFRMNGSWQSTTKVEGRMLRIIESKSEIVGDWKLAVVEVPAEEQPPEAEEQVMVKRTMLVMTSRTTNLEAGWEKGVGVEFEVVSLTEEDLILKKKSGRIMQLKRLRSEKAAKDSGLSGSTSVHSEPLCVNVKKHRELTKSRYMCVDLNLIFENTKGMEYIDSIEIPVEDKVELKYFLHPRIREIIVLFLADKTYKDVKTLDNVKENIDDLKKVLQPYFSGRLVDIEVNKVVVTANVDSVDSFMNMYIVQEAEDTKNE
jgi:hypothetical protein